MANLSFLPTLMRRSLRGLLLLLLLSPPFSAQPSRPLFASASETQRVSVVVELTSAPVAVVYAQSQKNQVEASALAARTLIQLAEIESEQQALLDQLASLEPTILYRTQRIFNGIALRIDPSAIAQLRQIPGVQAVYPLIPKVPMHNKSLPVIGAPSLWEGVRGTKLTGEGIRVAVIDTGIDYIHSDLGGPGNINLYAQNDKTSITDGMPYPNAKVIGGYDFSGDSYDADPESTTYAPNPKPDLDPMDCYGHGTHVAGTVAGNGVNQDGSAYTGPYNEALDLSAFRVAPGVAPKAQLYALKVFGCSGSSELADLAIEWAVDPNGDGDLSDHVDVINMSLGSSYGAQADVSTIASNNAAAAGVIVVASAGNNGDVHYITGSPAVADGAISVAASSYDSANQVDQLASFSSRGPRRDDSVLKPDIAAPGVNIVSASLESGSYGRSSSGTSMAAPHVAGSIALLRQLYPNWTAQELKALVMNSAQPFVHLGSSVASNTYTAARIGAGRIDLRAATKTTVLAFDDEVPERVSLSFGMLDVTERSTFTRTLAVLNKGAQPVTATLSYLSRTDVPGVEVKLPQTTLSVPVNTLVTVPIVLSVNPSALARSHDDTLQDIGTRYWLSEVMGNLELQPSGADNSIHVPLYAIARPASHLRAKENSFDFGSTPSPTFTLSLSGTGFLTTNVGLGYNSLFSLLELQWSSPQERPVAPIDPRLVVGSYDNGDIQYVGILNNLANVGSVDQSTLYFGVTTYGDWTSPNEVTFNIYLDTDQDGTDDYRLYNTNRFSMIDEHLNSDRFIAALENLKDKSKSNVAPLNTIAADQGDAALFHNNVLVLPLPVSQIGLDENRAAFNYRIESKVAELGGIIDRSPTLHYALTQQTILTSGANSGIAQAVKQGDHVQLGFEAVRGSGKTTAILLFHDNMQGERLQLVRLQGTVVRYYFPLMVR